MPKKTLDLLRAAGEVYSHLYEKPQQNIRARCLRRCIDLLFQKDMSFFEKIRVL